MYAAVSLAHEVPPQATVRLLIEPAGDQLTAAVRVPLASMRDVEFPVTEAGYLDLVALEPRLADLAATWILPFVELSEDGRRLPEATVAAVQVSLPSDRSFGSMEAAVARIRRELPANEENLVAEQVYFDLLLECPIRSASSDFVLRARLDHLADRVRTVVSFYSPGGEVRVYQLDGDPGPVALDPGWSDAALRFVRLGFEHIVSGRDHLLFLFCLVVPFGRVRELVWIVTAFTAAHSLTLAAAVAGWTPQALWFPPLVETLIAGSILWTALENIVAPPTVVRRWIFACLFGLIHGLGLSFGLSESLQFAGGRMWTSLLAFNLGVELGQLAVLLLLVPLLTAFLRVIPNARTGAIVLSALAAHSAWHWTEERLGALGAYDGQKPLLLAAAGAGLAWLALAVLKKKRPLPREGAA